jgi:hypothetical protein
MAQQTLRAVRRARIVLSFLCCVFFALAALAMAGAAALDGWRAWNARAWPTTAGLVMSATLQSPCDRGEHAAPRLRYAYTVGTTTYVGERIEFGARHCGAAAAAEDFLRRHPAGSALSVYYDPADPGQASLRVDAEDVRLIAVASIAPALALFAFGALGALVTLPAARRELGPDAAAPAAGTARDAMPASTRP